MTTQEAAEILLMRPTQARIAHRDGTIPASLRDGDVWNPDAVMDFARERKDREAGWGNRCARATAGGVGRDDEEGESETR